MGGLRNASLTFSDSGSGKLIIFWTLFGPKMRQILGHFRITFLGHFWGTFGQVLPEMFQETKISKILDPNQTWYLSLPSSEHKVPPVWAMFEHKIFFLFVPEQCPGQVFEISKTENHFLESSGQKSDQLLIQKVTTFWPKKWSVFGQKSDQHEICLDPQKWGSWSSDVLQVVKGWGFSRRRRENFEYLCCFLLIF